VPVLALQVGVAPLHNASFVGEHWPHAPLAWHAGASGSVQSESESQASHVPDERLQMGVAPEQRESLAAEHWPHAPFG
jgi:hypothetical protein